MNRWTAVPLATALSLSMATGWPGAAAATQPDAQVLHGTLEFCEEAPCELGTLDAVGPLAGPVTAEIIGDRPNHRYSLTQLDLRLTTPDADSVTLAITLRNTGVDESDPCRVPFTLDGRWHVHDGSGRYADLQGEGSVHIDALAIDHDDQCGNTPTSYGEWNLSGRAHHLAAGQ